MINLNSPINQLMYTTVLVRTSKSIGTGFLFSRDINDEKGILFIVTNRHVVENADKGILLFT